MTNTIKTGTILIREGALLPESLLIESEPHAQGGDWSNGSTLMG